MELYTTRARFGEALTQVLGDFDKKLAFFVKMNDKNKRKKLTKWFFCVIIRLLEKIYTI